MKNICFLILAHGNLGQVRRTIGRLAPCNAYFVIHIDEKCTENIDILHDCDNLVICQERHDVRWGQLSMMDAVMTMCTVASSQCKAHHYILISGHDYPAKSASYIETWLAAHRSQSFMMGERLPSALLPWQEGGARRLKAYALPLNRCRIATIEPRRINSGNLKQFIKTALFDITKLPKAINLWAHGARRLPPIPIYGGDFWWIISDELLTDILDFNTKHPELRASMSDVANPDEVYFQTIAYNIAPYTIEKKRMRYISWSKKGNSPRWLTMENYNEIRAAVENPEALFIRKIKSPDVCDFIDRLIDCSQ